MCLLLWCSGAGQVLADNVLLLRSLETLSIRDINPVPVLQVLAQNAKHSVSRMGISLEEQPDLVRWVKQYIYCTHCVCGGEGVLCVWGWVEVDV